MQLSRYLHDSLDALAIGACEYDAAMNAVGWNRTFLQFFPEDEGVITVGESYADNLLRFYQNRLSPDELPEIERYVAEGVARHDNQTQPFEFIHHGRRLRASSLRAADGSRVRLWQQIDAQSLTSAAPEVALPVIEALSFMPDGATLLDSSNRVMAANEAFARLYDLPHGDIITGKTLDEIIAWCWRDAPRSGAWRAAIRNGLRYDGAPFEIELPGQRWLRVVARHNAEGIGFFTHADITAAKRQQMELLEAQEALRQANAALAQLAETDGLTGLANHRRFVGALAEAAADARPIALMMIDVDHFKTINDRFGHLVGDACLKAIACVIAEQLRQVPALAARIGGEEFGVLCPGMRIETVSLLAAAIRHSLAQVSWSALHPELTNLTVSVGLCTGEGPLDGTALHAGADHALYAAKHNGRDRMEMSSLPQMPLRIVG